MEQTPLYPPLSNIVGLYCLTEQEAYAALRPSDKPLIRIRASGHFNKDITIEGRWRVLYNTGSSFELDLKNASGAWYLSGRDARYELSHSDKPICDDSGNLQLVRFNRYMINSIELLDIGRS